MKLFTHHYFSYKYRKKDVISLLNNPNFLILLKLSLTLTDWGLILKNWGKSNCAFFPFNIGINLHNIKLHSIYMISWEIEVWDILIYSWQYCCFCKEKGTYERQVNDEYASWDYFKSLKIFQLVLAIFSFISP